ncbi:MAG: hypothetical protein R2831_08535 [Chitinophagaceae bacterium]
MKKNIFLKVSLIVFGLFFASQTISAQGYSHNRDNKYQKNQHHKKYKHGRNANQNRGRSYYAPPPPPVRMRRAAPQRCGVFLPNPFRVVRRAACHHHHREYGYAWKRIQKKILQIIIK